MTSSTHPKDRFRAVSCAECRRSKTRCNRTFPCHACIKRGCEDICPDGVLIKPKRDRIIDSPAIVELRDEIERLQARIRELEKAASLSPPSSTGVPSPSQPASGTFSTVTKSASLDADESRQPSKEDFVNAFGTLSIGDLGQLNHHNQAASAEYLFEIDSECRKLASEVALDGIKLPIEVLHLAELFPNARSIRSSMTPELRSMILSFIPPADKVLVLVDRYYSHIGWMYDPIPREQFMDRVYDRIFYSNVSLDHVALLFIILALSVLLDLSRPFNYEDSEPYYLLALASFSLESNLTAPTLASLQCLQLISIYTCLSERTDAEERWLLLGIIVRMTQSAGLYRDFSSWLKCDAAEIEQRRRLFWELSVYDAWTSFVMGRPAVLASSKQVETKLPQDVHRTFNSLGDPEPSFHHWKYGFANECLVPLLEEVLGAAPPTYQTILRLDVSIRRFPVPASLRLPPLEESARSGTRGANVSLEMQKYYVLWLKETTLLYLHRSFFAHAVSVCPSRPLQSKYAPSVLAVYRSASLMVRRLCQLNSQQPLTQRIWTFWSSVFSAAIVLGALVVRSPRCPLAQCALRDLDQACELLEKCMARPRSVKALAILRSLSLRAHKKHANHTASTGGPTRNGPTECSEISGDDELTIFGGQTRLVLAPTRSRDNVPHPSLQGSINPEASNAHPELWTDINALTSLEGLSELMSLEGASFQEGTDGIVPDLAGFGWGLELPNDESIGPAASAEQQSGASWQHLMNEVANMEY